MEGPAGYSLLDLSADSVGHLFGLAGTPSGIGVVVMDRDLDVERTWSVPTGQDGGIGVSPTPNPIIAVADNTNMRVIVYDAGGNQIAAFGSRGSDKGQFKFPINDVTVDDVHNIYVADAGNNRVQAFGSHGGFQAEMDLGAPQVLTSDRLGNTYIVAGATPPLSLTRTEAYLDTTASVKLPAHLNPDSFAADGAGDTFLTDQEFPTITQSSSGLDLLEVWPSTYGDSDGIATDFERYLFVVDTLKRVIRYTLNPVASAVTRDSRARVSAAESHVSGPARHAAGPGGRRASVSLICGTRGLESCGGSAALRRHGRLIGRVGFTLDNGEKDTVKVPLRSRFRRALAQRRRLRVGVVVRTENAGRDRLHHRRLRLVAR
jgi:hypothetical protein